MDWLSLEQELDLWEQQDRSISFWWRDDDAVAHTPQLDELLIHAATLNVPVALAVVPALLESSLVSRIGCKPEVSVLQHGYAHNNHAPKSEKKAEFGAHRDIDTMVSELAQGSALLHQTFAQQYVPVFVPPWNRFSVGLVSALPEQGYRGMSGMWARVHDDNRPSCFRTVNTHADPIAWRSDRGFTGLSDALEQIISHLRLRREFPNRSDEATGLLTHHLDQNAEVWAFCKELIERTASRPKGVWLSAADIWG